MEAAPRCGGAARQGLLGPSRHSPALVGTPRRLRAGERQEAAPRVESRGGPLTGAELGPPGARNGLWLPCQSVAGRRPLWGCPGAPANSRGLRQGASWQPVRRGSPRGCLSFPHAGLRAGDARGLGGWGGQDGAGARQGPGRARRQRGCHREPRPSRDCGSRWPAWTRSSSWQYSQWRALSISLQRSSPRTPGRPSSAARSLVGWCVLWFF